jgi:thiol-disulfide isomerase/thioredoxin
LIELTSTRRALLLLLSGTALFVALMMALSAGLPERATFTGGILLDNQLFAPEINALAPPFVGQTLTGESVRLADLRGKPVVINFWATWCEPCRVEMPDLQRVYDQYQNQGLRILAVNLGESRTDVAKWAQDFGLTFDVILDEDQRIGGLYYLRGQPSTYVVSPDGVITHIILGPTSESALSTALKPFLS